MRRDQRINGGQWVALGDFDLAPSSSHRVELSDDAQAYVLADAVRFERLGDSRLVQADAVKFVKNDAEAGYIAYVHTDHLGAPQKMTDSSGQVVWDALFTPFGEEDSIVGSAANDNRFPGQLFDAETELHYNYFRDYDPTLGRYVQSDPIGLAGGLNTYAYVGGNPVNYVDPTGEIRAQHVLLGLVAGGLYGVAQYLLELECGVSDATASGVTIAFAAGAVTRGKGKGGFRGPRVSGSKGGAAVSGASGGGKPSHLGGGGSGKKVPKSGLSAREAAKDVPSWAKGERPNRSESGSEFAKRLMDQKYGPNGYNKGPGSEFSQIQKWGDRAFKDPG